MQPRITVVTLGVADLSRSVDFYRHAFEWEPGLVVEGEVAFYDLSGLVLSLWQSMAEELGRPVTPGGSTLAHNLSSPQEVDAAVAAAVAAGATVVTPAEEQSWGGYSAHVADPDGHLWEFAYNPDWPLGEDGRPRPSWSGV